MTGSEAETLKEVDSKLDKVISKIDKMEVILLGNGSKGHEQRLEDVEKWKRSMPDKCPAAPLSKGDVIKRRMLEVSIMGLIIASVELIIGAVAKVI